MRKTVDAIFKLNYKKRCTRLAAASDKVYQLLGQINSDRSSLTTVVMPTHVKISIEPGIRELFLKYRYNTNVDITV
jgi:hypothetical protein